MIIEEINHGFLQDQHGEKNKGFNQEMKKQWNRIIKAWQGGSKDYIISLGRLVESPYCYCTTFEVFLDLYSYCSTSVVLLDLHSYCSTFVVFLDLYSYWSTFVVILDLTNTLGFVLQIRGAFSIVINQLLQNYVHLLKHRALYYCECLYSCQRHSSCTHMLLYSYSCYHTHAVVIIYCILATSRC